MILPRDKHQLVITVDNIGPEDAIALKKMFQYMEYLGQIGSSRVCSFYADGDGSFRPKVKFDYPIDLPEVEEIDGVIESRSDERGNRGDFFIDSDSIAWKIYHEPDESNHAFTFDDDEGDGLTDENRPDDEKKQ